MKIIQLASIAFAFCLALVGFARPASACLPVTGIFTAVQEQQFLNNAFFQLRGNNAGSSAPSDDCSGAPVKGQFWLNTSSVPNAFSIYDGLQQDVIGYVDPTNNLWLPVLGGGVATATAASVLDLCNGPPPTPQNEITISGSTPITSFGASCAVGQFKFLKFTGSSQIVYNAGSILTPNGQSFYAENGGRAIVIYQGSGIWDVFSYHAPGGDVPAGTIQATTSTTPDAGYLLCYGQSLAMTAYPNLFAKIGYLFGGSGSNFNVPDLRGYYLAGLDNMGGAAANRITNFNADNIGNIGGAQFQAIAQANLPNVNFPLSLSYSASGSSNGLESNGSGASVNWTGGSANGPPYYPQTSFFTPTVGINMSISLTVNSGGSGTALPTLPPTKIVAYEIKY